MNKDRFVLAALALALAILTGCENLHRQDYGMLAGAGAGGLVGGALTDNNPIGIVAGAAGGAYVGREIAK